jgi:hypothetical protein
MRVAVDDLGGSRNPSRRRLLTHGISAILRWRPSYSLRLSAAFEQEPGLAVPPKVSVADC